MLTAPSSLMSEGSSTLPQAVGLADLTGTGALPNLMITVSISKMLILLSALTSPPHRVVVPTLMVVELPEMVNIVLEAKYPE